MNPKSKEYKPNSSTSSAEEPHPPSANSNKPWNKKPVNIPTNSPSNNKSESSKSVGIQSNNKSESSKPINKSNQGKYGAIGDKGAYKQNNKGNESNNKGNNRVEEKNKGNKGSEQNIKINNKDNNKDNNKGNNKVNETNNKVNETNNKTNKINETNNKVNETTDKTNKVNETNNKVNNKINETNNKVNEKGKGKEKEVIGDRDKQKVAVDNEDEVVDKENGTIRKELLNPSDYDDAPSTVKDDTIELDRLLEIHMFGEKTDEVITHKILMLIKRLKFPYNGLYRLYPPAFDYYIKNRGINNTDCYIDIPYIIMDCINETNNEMSEDRKMQIPEGFPISINWDLFINRLSICNYDFPDKELFLTKVCDTKKLIDVQKLGWNDHRLEHGITTLQRLIRYRVTNPPPEDEKKTVKWLKEFEDLHHKREDHWTEHHIHVQDLKSIKMRYDGAEESILYWNRHLITDILMQFLHSTCNGLDMAFYCDMKAFIGMSLEDILNIKKEKITSLIKGKVNYDFYCKFDKLVLYYLQGKLGLWRSKEINVLKFLEIMRPDRSTNLPNQRDENHLYNIIIKFKYYQAKEIIDKLDTCTFTYGLKMMKEFNNINIDMCTIDDLKKWFDIMIVDSLDKVIDATIKVSELKSFLANEINPEILRNAFKIIGFIKKTLINYQAKMKNNLPLHTHEVHYESPVVRNVLIRNYN